MRSCQLRVVIIMLAFYAPPHLLVSQEIEDDRGVLSFSPKLVVTAETEHVGQTAERGIVLHESEFLNTCPLLPRIFFDEAGSTSLPTRYQQFGFSYQTDSYIDTAPIAGRGNVDKYREILNIIGYRMRNRPQATIVLEGRYSSEPGEREQTALTRAETVREYLTTIWKIEPERIGIAPPRQSCDSSALLPAREEGRCVRIQAHEQAILSSLRVSATTTDLERLRLHFHLDPMMEAGQVASIEIDVLFADSLLSSHVITGNPDSALYRIGSEWIFPEKFFSRSSFFVDGRFAIPPIQIRARLRTTEGTIRTANTVTVPVTSRRYSADVRYHALSLPIFDYRETALDQVQQAWLDEILQKTPPEGARYQIHPATDPNERADAEEKIEAIRNRTKAEIDLRRNRIKVRFIDEGTEDDPDESPEADQKKEKGIEVRDKDTLNELLATARAAAISTYIQDFLRRHGDTLSIVESGTWILNPIFLRYETPEERYYNRGLSIYRHNINNRPEKADEKEGRGER